MRLAIVGSVTLGESPKARRIVREVIDRYRTDDQREEFVVVSGGAPGIDSLAEMEAEARGIPTAIFRPCQLNHRHTFRECYQPRNEKIARYCTRLVRIVDPKSRTYGSGWTRDKARELGRPTEEHVASR